MSKIILKLMKKSEKLGEMTECDINSFKIIRNFFRIFQDFFPIFNDFYSEFSFLKNQKRIGKIMQMSLKSTEMIWKITRFFKK